MTSPDPLKRRDDLQAQRQHAYDTYAEQAQIRQRAERARASADRRLHEAESAQAPGEGGQREVETVMATGAEAVATYEKALHLEGNALEAVKACEVQLAQLYSDEFVTFAEEATVESERADAAMRELCVAYRRAEQFWAKAQVAWQPVCNAVGNAGVEPFPLPEHQMAAVINGWDSLPPSIEITRDGLEEVAG